MGELLRLFDPAAPDAPPDQPARDRVRDDLGATLFVEAGAGSGKTRALVERLVALVRTSEAELRHVAAITFTEKAATELRDRVRRELEATATEADAAGDRAVAERCRRALDQLDGAAIGTLHAFAQRLLGEHPVEAGLPPRIEVLDEVASGVEFDRRWSSFRDELLADPALERTLVLLLAAGARPEALRALAEAFDDNWDLVEERVPADAPEPPRVHDLAARALVALDDVCALRAHCRDPEDTLCQRLDLIAEWAARLRGMESEEDLLEALDPKGADGRPSFKVGNRGRKTSWDLDKADVQARVAAAGEGLGVVRDQVTDACGRRLGAALRRFTLQAAAERRAEGRLQFHDLLVLARALLRDPRHGARVRATLHGRYRRLLLDEFQDTDPIQIELAVRMAAVDPAGVAAGRDPWPAVAVAPGHLFVVGDPKQSIYRFRRADVATFVHARDHLGGTAGGAVVRLQANFRTGAKVIEWVNRVFARLMAEEPEADAPVPSQPEYVPLDPVRPGAPVGPPVAVLGRRPHPGTSSATDVRAAEAADVAAAVATVVAEGWSVRDEGEPGGWRPARLGDVTVLVPARTSLPFLEDALEEAGIPARTESSSLVYATRAVRDLLMVLRAVADPTDHLAVVSALRTPLLACGDDDLFRFRVERGGRWSPLADQPPTVPGDDPVAAGLAVLRALHAERHWRAPSELLARVIAERRAMELGLAEGRARDLWRRLRFVVDQARAWAEATGGGLRDYLRWVEQQTAEGARVAEAILPETDDDAVRIMTIHAAKGLEFPVTIVSGLSSRPGGAPAAAQVVFPATGGEPGYRFGGKVVTREFADWQPIDEQMAFDERVRLLYVACTRAADHLVVSVHRQGRANPPKPASRTNAELLVDGMGPELLEELPELGGRAARRPPPPVATPPPPPPEAEWAAEREAALRRAARPTTVAATALTAEGTPDVDDDPHAGLRKRPRDLDLPPWLKGRYGTAVGRAVHGTLQTVALADGAGLDAAVAAQCEAEALPERAGDVRSLVAAALGSPSVREAAALPHWREVYACVPGDDGRLLEGYVDLLYRRPDGLVVLDYKTAATADPGELDRRVGLYRLQGAAYAHAVAEAAGDPVVRVTFVFLTPAGAVERHLPDLDAAVAEVRTALREGWAVTLG